MSGHATLCSADGRLAYELQVGSNRVGRTKAACEIVLRSSRSISGRHADLQVALDENGLIVVTLADLESTNGTFVNGTHLTGRRQRPVPLKDGDVLRFGYDERSFVVHIETPETAMHEGDLESEPSQTEPAHARLPAETLLSPIADLDDDDNDAGLDPLGATTIGPPSRRSVRSAFSPRVDWQRKLKALQKRIDKVEAIANTPRLASAARSLASGTRDIEAHDESAIQQLEARIEALEESAGSREAQSRNPRPRVRARRVPASRSRTPSPRPAHLPSPFASATVPADDLEGSSMHIDEMETPKPAAPHAGAPQRGAARAAENPTPSRSQPRQDLRSLSPLPRSAGIDGGAPTSKASPASWSRDFGSFDRRKSSGFFSASLDPEDDAQAQTPSSVSVAREARKSQSGQRRDSAQAWTAEKLDPDDVVLDNAASETKSSITPQIKSGLGMLARLLRRRERAGLRIALHKWAKVARKLGALEEEATRRHSRRAQQRVFGSWKRLRPSPTPSANSAAAQIAVEHQRRAGALWLARTATRLLSRHRYEEMRRGLRVWSRWLALCKLRQRSLAKVKSIHLLEWRKLTRRSPEPPLSKEHLHHSAQELPQKTNLQATQLDELQDLTEELRISEQASALKDLNLILFRRLKGRLARSWTRWRTAALRGKLAERLRQLDAVVTRAKRRSVLAHSLARWQRHRLVRTGRRAVAAQRLLQCAKLGASASVRKCFRAWSNSTVGRLPEVVDVGDQDRQQRALALLRMARIADRALAAGWRRWKSSLEAKRDCQRGARSCARTLERNMRRRTAQAFSRWRLLTAAARGRAAGQTGFAIWTANFTQRPVLRVKALRDTFYAWRHIAQQRRQGARRLARAVARRLERVPLLLALDRWRREPPRKAQTSEEARQDKGKERRELAESKSALETQLVNLEVENRKLEDRLQREQSERAADQTTIRALRKNLQAKPKAAKARRAVSPMSKRASPPPAEDALVDAAVKKAQKAAEAARSAAQRVEASASEVLSRAESKAREESARIAKEILATQDSGSAASLLGAIKTALQELRQADAAPDVSAKLRACLEAAEDRATRAEDAARAQLVAFEQAAREQNRALEIQQTAFKAALEASEARAKTIEALLHAKVPETSTTPTTATTTTSAPPSSTLAATSSHERDVAVLKRDLDQAKARILAYEAKVEQLLPQKTALEEAIARAETAETRLAEHLDKARVESLQTAKAEAKALQEALDKTRARAEAAEVELQAYQDASAKQDQTSHRIPASPSPDRDVELAPGEDNKTASRASTAASPTSVSPASTTASSTSVQAVGNTSMHRLTLIAAWMGGMRAAVAPRSTAAGVLARSFAAWRRASRASRKRVERASRSSKRRQHVQLCLAFAAWRQAVAARRKTCRIVRFAGSRYMQKALQQRGFFRLKLVSLRRRHLRVALRAWRAQASRDKSTRRTLARLLISRRTRSLKARIWTVWRDHLSTQRTHRRAARIFGAYAAIVVGKNQMMRRQLVWASFRAWKTRTAKARQIRRRTLMSMCKRMRIMQLWWAFTRWALHQGLDEEQQDNLKDRQKLAQRRQRLLSRSLKRHVHKYLRRGFDRWKRLAQTRAILARHRGKLLRFETKLRARARAGVVLRQWRRVTVEAALRRRKALATMRSRSDLQLVQTAFSVWTSETRHVRRLGHLASRRNGAVLRRSFAQWKGLAKMRRAGVEAIMQRLQARALRNAFGAWVNGAVLTEAQRATARRIVRRMKVLRLKMGWRALYEHYIGDREVALARLQVSGKVRELAERSNRLLADHGGLTFDVDGGDEAFPMGPDDFGDATMGGDEEMPMDTGGASQGAASPGAETSPLRPGSPALSGSPKRRAGRKTLLGRGRRKKLRKRSSSAGAENLESVANRASDGALDSLAPRKQSRALRFGDPEAAVDNRVDETGDGPVSLEHQQQMLIETLLGQVQTLARSEEHKRKLLAKIVVPPAEGETKATKQSRGLVIKHLQEIDSLRGELDAVRRVSAQQEKMAARNLRAARREKEDLEAELQEVQREAARERQALEAHSRDANRRLDKLNELLTLHAGKEADSAQRVAPAEALALLRAQIGASRKSEAKARARLRDLGEAHMRLRHEHELLERKFEESSKQTKLRDAIRTLKAQLEDIRARNGLSEHVRRATALFPLSHRARSLTVEEALDRLLAVDECKSPEEGRAGLL